MNKQDHEGSGEVAESRRTTAIPVKVGISLCDARTKQLGE